MTKRKGGRKPLGRTYKIRAIQLREETYKIVREHYEQSAMTWDQYLLSLLGKKEKVVIVDVEEPNPFVQARLTLDSDPLAEELADTLDTYRNN